jgi:translation initiation factor IF-2
MSKMKISDMTKQLCDSAQELLQSVRQQQQQWRTRAQSLKRAEAALQKASEEAAEAQRAAAEAAEAQEMSEPAELWEADEPAAAQADAPQAAEPAQEKETPQAPQEAPVQEPVQEAPVQEEPAALAEPAQEPVPQAPEEAPHEQEAPQQAHETDPPAPDVQAHDGERAAQTETQDDMQQDKSSKKQERQVSVQEESVKQTKSESQQQAEQAPREESAGVRVLDFRTKESRERSKPQQPRTQGPVYISKPEPGARAAQPAREGGRPQGNAPRTQNNGPRTAGAPRPAQGGQSRTSGKSGDAPRGGGFGGGRGGASRRGGGIAAAIAPVQEKRGGSNYDPNKNQYASKKSDPEKKGLNRRAQRRMTGEAMNYGEEDGFRSRKKKKNTKAAAHVIEPVRVDHAVMATERISVKDLSEKIGRPASEIIKKLFLLGIMATINNEIDFDTAQLVCDEFGVELEQKLEKTFEDTLLDQVQEEEDEENLQERPPVVTIMGHVDHGKTSLLDMIRKTHVTATEAGGITQHIGAYSVTLNGRKITFLDTPGHEAFTAMRARGAQATDIAVLVVAADDGIMPQTIEAINHAKAANVSVIVAVNKIDRPAANVERVTQQLTEYGLVPEEWGGDTIVVPVSAHTGENIDRLLEMILLVADVMELRANPDRRATGIIIEARLDKGRGPVATVLVKNGTLRVGDTIVAGTAYGRVRAMQNDRGERVTQAGPSDPVEVIGFNDVPEAGDNLYAVEESSLSRQVAQERRDRQKAEQLKAMSKVSLDDLFSQIEQGNVKELNVIVKADVQGSVEAVRTSLEKISNEEVRVRAIHGGVGAITPTDVMLASASNAIIVGFNVRPQPQAKEAAEQEKVDIRLYRVIYQAIEDIENAIHGMLAPVYQEVILGHVQVREVYRVSRVGTIAGCYVTDGKITRNAKVRLVRDGVVVHEGDIASLRRFKDDVREVAQGYECGVGLVNYNDIKQGDQLEAFVNEQVEA